MRAGIAIGAKIILISKNRKDETTLETQPDLRRASLVIIKAL
jgi:hypothetical protein